MTRAGFSSSTLVEEMLRNLRSRWVLTVLVMATATAAGAATVLLGGAEVASIRADWDQQVAEGRFVYEVTGAGTSRLDAAACDAVDAWEGVRGAGGRVAVHAVHPVTAPGSRYDLDAVTPGYLRVLWPGSTVPLEGEVAVGPYAAETLGLGEGTVVAWSAAGGAGAVARATTTVPREGSVRDEGADRHLFATAPPTGSVDRCLVDIEPDRHAAVLSGLVAWFGSDADPPRPVHDFSRATDPEARLDARTSRWLWAAGAGLVGLVAAITWSIRRADVALYRLLGADTGSVAVLVGADAVVAVLTPALAGTAVALCVVAPDLGDATTRGVVLADAGRLLVSLTVVPVACLAVVATRSVFVTLKES